MNASLHGYCSRRTRTASFIIAAALLCVPSVRSLAQTPNTNYTADCPSVDRVKAEIKGSDPTDTLARQVAVFTYLQQYIQRIKYNRTVRGPYTPDEQKLLASYSLAAYQISQDYAKTHTADEARAFERLHGQYEMNSTFYEDWSKRLIGPQTAAAYHGMESDMANRQQAHNNAINRQNQQAAAASGSPGAMSNDPTAVATRRCLELGGSSLACVGKGLTSGIMGLIGLDTNALTDTTTFTGVVLSGLYKNSSGASLSFNGTAASPSACGKLVATSIPYTIEKRPNSLRVLIQNKPQPFTLTMRLDGGLTGPGPVDVTGNVIIGYHTVTATQMVNGVRAAPNQCNGPCQTVSTVPDYATRTERCSIGSLSMPPKLPPASPQSASADSGIMGLMTEALNTGEMTMNPEPGLRMSGKYAGGNLILDFTPTSVILDCGQAHIRQTYTVENAPNNLIIHINNPTGLLTLAVQPDNTLRGAGSTTVKGRLVSGMSGDNVTFVPTSNTCQVGILNPKAGN